MKVSLKTTVIPGEVSIEELRRRVGPRPDFVRVGLPDIPHPKTKLTFAQLGAIHEYGAPTVGIPARPFLRTALAEGGEELARHSQILAFEIQNGTRSKHDGLVLLGLHGVRLIQTKIVRGPFAPNAPATIRRKGSSKPLIDVGDMLRAVGYQIESE